MCALRGSCEGMFAARSAAGAAVYGRRKTVRRRGVWRHGGVRAREGESEKGAFTTQICGKSAKIRRVLLNFSAAYAIISL